MFVAGCEKNQARFHTQFDHIVLLGAPVETLVERLATRTSNPYGKARILSEYGLVAKDGA